jgi:tRNA(fMet)-specific endonuclease VapC
MIYVLDTDILIYMIRGLKSTRKPVQRQRAQALAQRCRQAQTAGDTVGISAVTVSELEFGARHSGDYPSEIAAVRKVLTPLDLFDYDAVACPPHYGRVRYEVESARMTIGAMDLLIAAHALALGATLVSNKLAHFGRVRALTTANWLA